MDYNYRVDGGHEPVKRARYTHDEQDLNFQWTATPLDFAPAEDIQPASKVLQLRGLPSSCIEAEVMSVMRKHATVVDCFMLASKGQALVEFERSEDAENVLLLQQQRQCITISNCVPQISFSHVESLASTPSNSASVGHNEYQSASAANQDHYYPQTVPHNNYHSSNHAQGSYYSTSASRAPHSTVNTREPKHQQHSYRHPMSTTRPDEHYTNGGGVTPNADRKGAKMGEPNKVLLFTILRPDYPITVRVLLAVCKKFNCNPVKIYIFRRRGVQAMVEFDSLETATFVKTSLDGNDIYSGCCTLKIDYARPESLKVTRNSDDTYNVNLLEGGDGSETNGRKSGRMADPGLLPPPPGGDYYPVASAPRGVPPASGRYQPGSSRGPGGVVAPYSRGGPAGVSRGLVLEEEPYMERDRRGRGTAPGHMGFHASADPSYYVPVDELQGGGRFREAGGMYGGGAGGMDADFAPAVVMLYGLDEEKFGPKRLFNLLCIFGNVNKIKFMKSKPGAAMVEMQGQEAVGRIISALLRLDVFGSEIIPKPSKQHELFENPRQLQQEDSKLPNGDSFYANFMGNRDQRFSTSLERSKNRVQVPKKTLHAFNLPASTTEENLRKIFEEEGCPSPKQITFVESKYKEEARKTSANVVFDSIREATETLVLANHALITDPNGRKATVRLCFSSGKDAE